MLDVTDRRSRQSAARLEARPRHGAGAARFLDRFFPLAVPLRRVIRQGDLTIVDAAGTAHQFGRPGDTPRAAIRLHDRALSWTLLADTDLRFGEAYMDGRITIEEGSLRDFLEIIASNATGARMTPWAAGNGQGAPATAAAAAALLLLKRFAQQHNPLARSRSNVAHHYDLSDTLYDLFLDDDRQYSCAYFANPADTLEAAQRNKQRHIAAKLLLTRPGMRVLDIGSGWGGLAIYLAKATGADVTGLTLSAEQHRCASQRALAEGLADRVRFHLRDYREEQGTYDRIVSVGMFEHVGAPQYGAFFATLKERLRPDGVALLHSIGRMDGPGTTNSWVRKYIFPGGYAPALSEVLPHVERTGLWATDIETLRLHYAETLKEWHRRFEINRRRIAQLYDERFCRMWELYLLGSEMQFRYCNMMVFQMQLARDVGTAPLTRDYMVDCERRLA
ncbi:MAG TPA: cyclopropane-fatty-acyl-phospholipid synthase family protein [Stellaceae bacterium]